MIPAADLDQLLLSFCTERWQKVARIIGKTYEVLETRGSIFTGIAEHVDVCMAALVGAGQLEAKGDIKRWGYSEVRLPGGRGEAVE
jgi:Protein of unknown function